MHFLACIDHEPERLNGLARLGLELKAGRVAPDFRGLFATLLFFSPSLRTRLSCQSALARYGGTAACLSGEEAWRLELDEGVRMDGPAQEHVREAAGVLSRMGQLIGARHCSLATRSGRTERAPAYEELARDEFLRALARHASVPVINLESNRFHPLQGLADRATILERLPEPRGERFVLTWAYHPKALPVATPHSQLIAACDLGMDVVLLRPEGYGLDPEVTREAGRRAALQGGALRETDDPASALSGARVVCAKSWGALTDYENPAREAQRRAPLQESWIVDEEKLARTRDAFFMHCLPVRRGVVVTDEVLDSPRSAVLDEAENRLWTAAALMADLCGRTPRPTHSPAEGADA